MMDDLLPWIAKPNRPMAPFRYFGGKGNLAKKIVPLLPPANVYCEPFCGAASVFWHLPEPYPVEVLNDLNGDLISVFRCLQDDEQFEKLYQKIIWTPYARAELERALEMQPENEVDRAWRFLVLYNFGFSGQRPEGAGNWSRTFKSSRGMADTANRWRGRMKMMEHFHDRLTRVQIDNRDALEVIKYWDSEDTLFYIDPPYVFSKREYAETDRKPRGYDFEMTDDQHTALVDLLLSLKGKVALSGYESDLYKPLEEAGWRRIDWDTACSATSRGRNSKVRGKGSAKKHAKRVECLWINYEQ